MITDIIENDNYKNLVTRQVKETLDYLLAQNQEFSITANIKPIKFMPELPDGIKNQLSEYSLFILSNYTFTTIFVDDSFISFEAGYGSENFGSTAKIPLHSVFQIIVDNLLILYKVQIPVNSMLNNLNL